MLNEMKYVYEVYKEKSFFQSGEEAFYQPASTQQHGAEGRERDGSADF